MQLGDWVEFDAIVLRDRSQLGTTPRREQLPSPRQGMLIGVRPVYDTAGNAPPHLSNRREVLLVALSLHTVVRVFPADARVMAAPPARRPRAFAGHGAAPQQLPSSDDDDDRDRDPVSDGELGLMVADALTGRIARSEWFTAYDITRELRAAHPIDNIRHDEVRALVHAHMQAALQSGLYITESATYGTDVALRYVPT